jgi:hypothetical protein
MTDTVLNTDSLQETLLRLIRTEKVRLRETDGEIRITPVAEVCDCTTGLRGMLAGNDDMSLDKFLERKHADKGLDL